MRAGADQAIVRAAVVKDGRTAVLEVEINPGRANRARVNKSPLPKTRDLVGLVRTVVFSPEDLALVKGDPAERRRFLDDLLVLRTPRLAGVRADYERILRQRNSLLKTAGQARRGSANQDSALSTLGVWNSHLARVGAEILAERLALVDDLRPYLGNAYATVARGASRDAAEVDYKPSFELPADAGATGARSPRRCSPRSPSGSSDELDRGVSLVGPHRDDLVLTLGPRAGDDGHPAAGARLRQPRRVVVVRAGAAAGVVRPAARRRRRPDPGPRRRVRRARHRAPRPARRAGGRRRAGAGDGGGRRRRAREAGRHPVPGRRRGGDRVSMTSELATPGDEARTATPTASTSPRTSPGRRPARRRPSATPQRRRATDRRTGRQGVGAFPDDRDPQLLDTTVGRLVEDHGWDVDLRVAGVFARWAELVGDEVARHVTPESFSDGCWSCAPTPRRGPPS